jgi:hypothetical protein
LDSVFEKVRTDEKRVRGAISVEGFWARVFYWGSVVGSKGEEGGEGKGKGSEK